jgi:alpha-tubulin suppressor-like RCC1 family protein
MSRSVEPFVPRNEEYLAMPHSGCIAPLMVPGTRAGREPRLIRLLVPILAQVLVLSALGCGKDATSPTGREQPEAPALAAVVATLSFRQVDVGWEHTCGVTMDDRAYCWGSNTVGQLGDGTRTDHLAPVAVAGDLRFRHVRVGSAHTCGVTTDYAAYCWGYNSKGQLGDSTTITRSSPVRVAGAHRFRQIRTGSQHTCALTTGNLAFCWGYNIYGQLGAGTTLPRRLTAVRVAGGLTFQHLTGGPYHTCGLATSGKSYCWGLNEDGRLGDGTTTNRLSPRAVAGGLGFRQLSAGGFHTCGVTAESRAYCWGGNPDGQLGDGTRTGHLTPAAVAGGLLFDNLGATGNSHACGVTPDHHAYCWGRNTTGQLGDGTTITRLTPTAVGGRAGFREVSTGGKDTCGLTPTDQAFCWGSNNKGQDGDGTTSQQHQLPVPVAAPM